MKLLDKKVKNEKSDGNQLFDSVIKHMLETKPLAKKQTKPKGSHKGE